MKLPRGAYDSRGGLQAAGQRDLHPHKANHWPALQQITQTGDLADARLEC